MYAPTQGRPGRRTSTICAVLMGAALVWLLATGTALAAETAAQQVLALQKAPVFPLSCAPCHAEIKDNKLPGINFSHASHISYQCAACHTRFPHQPEGTTVPKMPTCWTCHNLRHGPQGIMAKAQCEKCHNNTKSVKLRPASHIVGWKGKPHVAPAEAQLSTTCMMCHTRAQCDACHAKTNISWETTQSWGYDPGNGCLSCHGSDLPRLAAPVTASGLDGSAHRAVTCPKCHPDFRYDETRGQTKLWKVNAGLSCADCHSQRISEFPTSTAVMDWRASIHGSWVLAGKLKAPTCAGCHGGHAIERTKTQAAKDRVRLSGDQMCGRGTDCHAASYDSYNDWWHGAAYKKGSLDAPACWSCHPAHTVRVGTDPKSSVNAEQLGKTCGVEGCHIGTSEGFAAAWRSLPHGRPAVEATNALNVLKTRLGIGR